MKKKITRRTFLKASGTAGGRSDGLDRYRSCLRKPYKKSGQGQADTHEQPRQHETRQSRRPGEIILPGRSCVKAALHSMPWKNAQTPSRSIRTIRVSATAVCPMKTAWCSSMPRLPMVKHIISDRSERWKILKHRHPWHVSSWSGQTTLCSLAKGRSGLQNCTALRRKTS